LASHCAQPRARRRAARVVSRDRFQSADTAATHAQRQARRERARTAVRTSSRSDGVSMRRDRQQGSRSRSAAEAGVAVAWFQAHRFSIHHSGLWHTGHVLGPPRDVHSVFHRARHAAWKWLPWPAQCTPQHRAREHAGDHAAVECRACQTQRERAWHWRHDGGRG
jgi:hypothetical protein